MHLSLDFVGNILYIDLCVILSLTNVFYFEIEIECKKRSHSSMLEERNFG